MENFSTKRSKPPKNPCLMSWKQFFHSKVFALKHVVVLRYSRGLFSPLRPMSFPPNLIGIYAYDMSLLKSPQKYEILTKVAKKKLASTSTKALHLVSASKLVWNWKRSKVANQLVPNEHFNLFYTTFPFWWQGPLNFKENCELLVHSVQFQDLKISIYVNKLTVKAVVSVHLE